MRRGFHHDVAVLLQVGDVPHGLHGQQASPYRRQLRAAQAHARRHPGRRRPDQARHRQRGDILQLAVDGPDALLRRQAAPSHLSATATRRRAAACRTPSAPPRTSAWSVSSSPPSPQRPRTWRACAVGCVALSTRTMPTSLWKAALSADEEVPVRDGKEHFETASLRQETSRAINASRQPPARLRLKVRRALGHARHPVLRPHCGESVATGSAALQRFKTQQRSQPGVHCSLDVCTLGARARQAVRAAKATLKRICTALRTLHLCASV